uniref:uncharacterized protein LOC494354 precursor n=1 Tax=Ciona intestinalis TaxID=7719 RepID=UPI000189A717|nr:uncharacterized protein LOC494354 precursor [Ciona intestinalis]|eukprot:NP_001137141.1 uncharacterized protein LOC494354 precursor [Ciona intestinalis]
MSIVIRSSLVLALWLMTSSNVESRSFYPSYVVPIPRRFHRGAPYRMQNAIYSRPIYINPAALGRFQGMRRGSEALRNRYPSQRYYTGCNWFGITSREFNLMLDKIVGNYQQGSPHTLKSITKSSKRYCRRCGPRGCVPLRHEFNITVSLAPTDGCNWRDKCACRPVVNGPTVLCNTSGTIQYGSGVVSNFTMDCRSPEPAGGVTASEEENKEEEEEIEEEEEEEIEEEEKEEEEIEVENEVEEEGEEEIEEEEENETEEEQIEEEGNEEIEKEVGNEEAEEQPAPIVATAGMKIEESLDVGDKEEEGSGVNDVDVVKVPALIIAQ